METEPEGALVGAMFKSIIKDADPFRPVVAAMNYGWGEGLSYVLDIPLFDSFSLILTLFLLSF
jgi:hypothetical protein